jgi:transposase InsO family protein
MARRSGTGLQQSATCGQRWRPQLPAAETVVSEARRVWHDMLADGVSCGLHRIERLMRLQGLKARPRRRRLPPDLGERQAAAVSPNVLDRSFRWMLLLAPSWKQL